MLRVRKPARFAFVLTLAVLLAGVFGTMPAMAKPVEPERARVSVVVMQAPLASADTLTYTIKTINRGDSAAYHAVLVVPYDASALNPSSRHSRLDGRDKRFRESPGIPWVPLPNFHRVSPIRA